MNPPTRPRLARLCWSLVALAWLAVIAALINAGFTPDYWMLRHFEGATLPYPTRAVIQFAVLAGAELLVTVLIVRPWKPGRLWLRLLIALVLLLAWSFPWLAAALHQAPVQGMHLLCLLLLDLAVFLALCVVSLAIAWRAFNGKQTGRVLP
ncbi:hypothetical protein [Stenotrophomonas indicatrix]|uniref:hypothetical protein n=1 Tax=Stenotrophomonas indicatrix TaxID=2045451 RepID=UPI00215B5B52|nr:hypothetical protein [Stenotrophomonas indicatrix]MCR8714572.1 hypothetical protein [Stenotrophomonas indicatrix]